VAISNNTITTRKLRSYLGKCGYKGDLIQEDYIYSDSSGCEYNVPIAGFAYPSHDARDACIAGVDRDLLEEPTFESVANECRYIGAPVLFICCRKQLQWWTLKSSGVMREDTIPAAEVSNFFNKHKKVFSPESIYRAKNLSRVHSDYQLKFVDQGLMPVLEHEMGDRLADLIKNMLGALDDELGRPPKDIKLKRWMFQSAFWLLCAKILQDKEVKRFIRLDLEDLPAVLERVNRHYGAKEGLVFRTRRQHRALEAASKLVKCFSSLNNLTIESLAYVYETTLIDKETRKAWGIHATPSYLVDYIVWQLVDWIEKIPQKDRVIFEPTCGHAPFLISALRLLREIYEGDRAQLHKYLKSHLSGLEQGLFAREIARLSLTLADVPNPNGWKLKECNVYEADILSKLASKSTILLCNPPFEKFSKKEMEEYNDIKTGNKAAEVLARTLPYMPIGSVFGVILPRGFLHKENLAPLRKYIIENFEIREICLLPENVFGSASHLSCVVLGRKVRGNDKVTNKNKIRYVRIPKDNLDEFKGTYNAETEIINQQVAKKAPDYDFRLSILLSDVWEYCSGLSRLTDIAVVGRGLEYKNVANSTSQDKFKGAVQGFVRFSKTVESKTDKRKKIDIKLTELPDLYWMDLSDDAIENSRYGKSPECAQVLLNYARTSGNNPWRLKALIDREGMPVTNSFLVIRPKNKEWPLEVIWALINSPYANAFAFCYCMERHNLESIVRDIPLPKCNSSDLQNLKRMVLSYFALYQEGFFQLEPSDKEGEKRMSAINAEVMRLYDLPPKLERKLLDLFNDYKRKGIHFKFYRYFPKGFDSWIPLHEYLSEEYQRSTPSFVNEWVEKNRSPEVIRALEIAVEAFKED